MTQGPSNLDPNLSEFSAGLGGVFRDEAPTALQQIPDTLIDQTLSLPQIREGIRWRYILVPLGLVTAGGLIVVGGTFLAGNTEGTSHNKFSPLPVQTVKQTPAVRHTITASPSQTTEVPATTSDDPTETATDVAPPFETPTPTVTVTETAKPEPAPTVTATTTVTALPSQTPEQTPTVTNQDVTTPTVLIDVSANVLSQKGKDWWNNGWGWGHEKMQETSTASTIDTFEQELAKRLQANGVNTITIGNGTYVGQGDLRITLGSGQYEVAYDTTQAGPFNFVTKEETTRGCVSEKIATATWLKWHESTGDVAGPTNHQQWLSSHRVLPSMTINVAIGNGPAEKRKDHVDTMTNVIAAAVTDALTGLQTDTDECAAA